MVPYSLGGFTSGFVSQGAKFFLRVISMLNTVTIDQGVLVEWQGALVA